MLFVNKMYISFNNYNFMTISYSDNIKKLISEVFISQCSNFVVMQFAIYLFFITITKI